MRAAVNIREAPSYRLDAFKAGLMRLGYSIVPYFQRGKPEDERDLLVLWNLHIDTEPAARVWEEQGGTVIICENGYIGADEQGRQLYAVSVHGHNGAGWYPVGQEDRFAPLGLTVQPWQTNESGHILVCAQRGIGSREMASPPNWHAKAAGLLRKASGREVRVRLHPGNKGPAPGAPTLSDDLRGAWSCVIWSSSSGVKALLAGIPVFYDAPHWICSTGAVGFDGRAVSPKRDDASRIDALRQMAWGQWRVAEIEMGLPFDYIRSAVAEKVC
jgi:hypothetical protein